MILIPEASQPLIALAILAAMFAGFVWERLPHDVIAVAGVAAMLALGLLQTDDFVGVFANGAPIAIGALFILSGALIRTGALERLAEIVVGSAKTAPVLTLTVTAIGVLFTSAFLNNTPVVMIMIPIVLQFAVATKWPASQLLIPLSYASILGGGCTLIGTSTNLLVDGVAVANGLQHFSIFEITPIGIGAAIAGMAFMALAGPYLLPDQKTLAEYTTSQPRNPRFFTEVVIPLDSPLVDQKAREVALFNKGDTRVIDVLRGDASLRRDLNAVILQPGDRVVLRITVQEVLDLRALGLSVAGTVDALSSTDAITMEALVPPGSRLVGRVLGRLRLRRRYGVYPLAVHRRGAGIEAQLDNVRLEIGDTLLLEGAPEDIHRFIDDAGLINLTRDENLKPAKRAMAPWAIAVMLGVVLAAGSGIMPIVGAATIGVAMIMLLGILDPEEAFSYVDARLLALIVGMLAVGQGLQSAGAITLIINAIVPYLEAASPLMALISIFVLTSILTELVSNNAVAVILTPLAIGLAQTLGYDPRPFVIAVMAAANASFATPIGYQTNMLVYAPGGYKFVDYLRLGVPLKLVTGTVALTLIALLWPL